MHKKRAVFISKDSPLLIKNMYNYFTTDIICLLPSFSSITM